MVDGRLDRPLEEELEGSTDQRFSRRALIKLLSSGALVSALPACAPRPPANALQESVADPIHFSSVRALSSAIRRKMVSSEEVIRACLNRIETVNPKLNAVVQLNQERALARGREADAALARGENWGPLHGVPMTIKDSFDTAGMISTGGTGGRASFIPERDATVVERLRGAGAILLGKTNTPELTMSFETNNRVYGRTNNPYDVARTPGGSSGGAAAIVAAGGSPFDIGSDFGGSIRVPCHFCGLAGIKPSAGRVPRTGHIFPFGGIQDSFQQVGPLARYVDDLALILPLILGPDWIDPGVVPLPWSDSGTLDIRTLRVSFHTNNGIAAPTPDTVRIIEAVAASLVAARVAVQEVRPSGIDEALDVGLPLYRWDGGASVRRLLSAAGTTEHTLRAYTDAPAVSAAELDRLITRWYAWRSRMLSFVKNYDVIVCPVNASPALPHGATADPGTLSLFSYTMTYNLTGWPAAVVRAGTSPEGLPIGVQIVAQPGREDVALAVAKFVETARGGYRRPSI